MDESLVPSKERFCTILSLFISHRFFPMGGDLDTLAAIESSDGKNNGVIYNENLAPNLITPTSDEHITAKFLLSKSQN